MKKLPVEKQASKIVKRIIGGKYKTEVFNELYTIKEQLKRGVYTSEELAKYASLFCEYNLGEQRKLISQINKELLEEIRKENNSYLKNMRILEALNATEAINKVKKTSDKIKFCLEFYNLAAVCYDGSISTQFKVIALLDRA